MESNRMNLKCPLCMDLLFFGGVKMQDGTFIDPKDGNERDKDPLLTCKCYKCGNTLLVPLNYSKRVFEDGDKLIVSYKK